MEHTLWCGLERAEKVSYWCTKYELRGVSLLDTRVLLIELIQEWSTARLPVRLRADPSRAFMYGWLCIAGRLCCTPVLSFRCRCGRPPPHLAAVHAALTDFCLQGPLSPKFSAPAAGTGRGRWRSKTRVKCWSVRASVRSGDLPGLVGRFSSFGVPQLAPKRDPSRPAGRRRPWRHPCR